MKNINYNKQRFSTKLRILKGRIEYMTEEYKAGRFGVAEGCILSIQGELTLLYGLMLNVQDDKIRGNK